MDRMQEGISLLVISASLFILHIVLLRALGRSVWVCCKRWFSHNNACHAEEESRFPGFPPEFALGLTTFLVAFLVLKSFGGSWGISCCLPFLFLISRRWRNFFAFLKQPLPRLSLGHLVWLIVHIVLGTTLIEFYEERIISAWRNAYGDYPFHLGMITSFVRADNFPPEQIIYADGFLQYPFLINLWSAVIWKWNLSYSHLALIFLFQWLLLWEVVYQVLSSKSQNLLPWFILLAGGGYASLGQNSGQMIPRGMSWTSFLTTIWIPQRSALFGAMLMLITVQLFFHWRDSPKDRRVYGGVSGILLGFMPLAHTHFFLLTALFIGMQLAILLYKSDQKTAFLCFLFQLFSPGVLLSFHALPFLYGKESLFILRYSGFLSQSMVREEGGLLNVFQNVWPISLVFLITFVFYKQKKDTISLIILAIIFWFVGLSVWEWDQIKLYVGLVVLLALIMKQEAVQPRRILHSMVFLFIIPTTFELWTIFQRGEMYEMFDRKKIYLAEKWHRALPARAVVLSAPDHNGAVVLTGRKLFAGYEGWLWSHGIDYQGRMEAQRELIPALDCEGGQWRCPSHFVWSEAEERYWGQDSAPQHDNLTPISDDLFKIQLKSAATSIVR